ncbi:MAG: hypothetical protein HY554_09090 [Elusimicrobia bacterium]|nr:hypothetical protein [Elusimicrobiota bacterium]
MDERIRPGLGAPDKPARNFGFLWSGVFALLGLWAWRHGKAWAPAGAGLAVAALALALLRPGLLEPPRAAWMRFALALARVNTKIVLGLLYFGVLTPLAVFLRLKGDDPLELEAEGSLWRERSAERKPERYEKQF